MNTYGIRYLGSKRLLVKNIVELLRELAPNAKTIIDVFTGTTRVAQAFRQSGYNGIASDLVWASKAYAGAFLFNENNTYLQEYINMLNSLKGYRGWLTKNYSEVKKDNGKIVRVWQEKNAMKADAIRDKIEELELEDWEKYSLITSLIFALSSVDNTVGIQEAYLRNWCSRSYNDMVLKNVPLVQGPKWQYIEGNALEINYPSADVAYLDPPYTGASYSSYYHIWDSVVKWDKPKTVLNTNRREDRSFSNKNADASMRSAWNSKKTVYNAFEKLLERLPVKHFIISYSNESLIKKKDLNKILSKYNKVICIQIDYKRHIMSKIGSGANSKANMKNIEYLFYARK